MGRLRQAWLVHEGAEIALVDSFLADLFDLSLDRLVRDAQVGQFGQITRRLLIGNIIDLDQLASHLVTQHYGDGFQLRELGPSREPKVALWT
jgi:hypothetical protein